MGLVVPKFAHRSEFSPNRVKKPLFDNAAQLPTANLLNWGPAGPLKKVLRGGKIWVLELRKAYFFCPLGGRIWKVPGPVPAGPSQEFFLFWSEMPEIGVWPVGSERAKTGKTGKTGGTPPTRIECARAPPLRTGHRGDGSGVFTDPH